MSLTASNQFPIGSIAPDFTLPDTISGKTLTLNELRGVHGTVIMFICNHCPFVIHINSQLIAVANDYLPKGINFIAISSNDVESYPDDSPELMKTQAERLGYPFPYLYDESQKVAKVYDAACTPDIYLFDSSLKSIYHGQLDSSRPGNDHPITGNDLRMACDALLNNEGPIEKQLPSMGCNIKWKN